MKLVPYAAVAALALAGGYAIAQTYPVAILPTLSPSTDVTNVVPGGVPQAQAQYAHLGQISGAILYQDLGVATTGNTYTYTSGQKVIFMRPSATLGAVTLVTESNPSDGQVECFTSTQTTTSLTWTAATGQTMNPTITAGVANVPICLIYEKASATWYEPVGGSASHVFD
jgi:hypothetical protein